MIFIQPSFLIHTEICKVAWTCSNREKPNRLWFENLLINQQKASQENCIKMMTSVISYWMVSFCNRQAIKFLENYISSLHKKQSPTNSKMTRVFLKYEYLNMGGKNILCCCPNIPTSLYQMKKLFKQIKTTLVSKLNQGTTSWDILIDS